MPQTSKPKLIIVSNRLPVSISRIDGKLDISPSSGGLATAMSALEIDTSERLWIGWPGIASDELSSAEKALITRKLRSYGCYPVFLTKAQLDDYYDGYSNATIWPLFHYFQSATAHNADHWHAYRHVNALFRRVVEQHAAADTTVWVHDYQLMLLPGLLREHMPKASIGFFLHIPFPSFEIFRLLPERKAILEGLLGADLIGFHIYDYVRHFTSSSLRVLGHGTTHGTIFSDSHTATIDAFPLGIDYPKFAGAVALPEVIKERKILDQHYKNQKIILSVDRLDYSKGIEQRLEAFEHFLSKYPKWHKKVTLVMVAVPSRVSVESYKTLRQRIEQAVSRINGLYGSMEWTPISYRFQHLPFEQIAALYARAEVMLVTPLRDGMNLVAKEYVACKQESPGVLILSELAGAADELFEALRVNPNDTVGIAETIDRALSMSPARQIRRLHSMQQRLASYTVQRWARDFLGELDHTRDNRTNRLRKLLDAEGRRRIVGAFQKATHRAIFLDYDGTLNDFVDSPDPEHATPPRRLLSILKSLAAQSNTQLTIVSGRTREALEKWFSDLPINLVAEHGAWIREDGTWVQEQASFKTYRQELLDLLHRYAGRTPGAIVEEKSAALVWHYRNVTPELAYARNLSLRHEIKTIIAESDLAVWNGQKIMEIRPHGINKGAAVSELLATQPADFVLCIGDDYTDEDMFSVLTENAYTIRVGLEDTRARYQLTSPEKVLSFLREFTQ